MKRSITLDRGWELSAPDGNGWLPIPSMPVGVHEFLHSEGLISDDFLIGQGGDSLWVAERDWAYRCEFKAENPGARAYLNFELLDTIARILLNGEEIAYNDNGYIPLRVEVTGRLRAENTLEIRFQSPYAYLEEHPLKPEWEGKIRRDKMMRKPFCDFSNYLGAVPYITLIGVFGDIALEYIDRSELTECRLEAVLSADLESGSLEVSLSAEEAPGLRAGVTLTGPDGRAAGSCEIAFPGGKGSIAVASPALWWPRGYGGQPLYTAEVTLYSGDEAVDRVTREVGFRTIRMALDFDLHVNGRKVRMFGSNISPQDGRTHRWNGARMRTVLDLVELANMNTMRIWGEGEHYDDELYEQCDRRGILLWQEFFGGYGMQPDTREFYDQCLREAEYQVKRLRHHASVFMWCGGNEGMMGRDFDQPGEEMIGERLYTELSPALLARPDPGRYYHPSSPHGGAFANDPRVGDTHGYDFWWKVPGIDYPVAYSELMRVSGPALKSVRRWIPEDKLWPEGYVDSTTPGKRANDLMPPAWAERVANSLDIKAGPIHEFRDADSPAELAFKYSAAHAKAFKDGIKRSRMGRPSGSKIPRISNAHLIWKFADTWPLIYSAIVDYYLEPYIPYYEAKRGYEPVTVCFDIRDSITLWLVNDGIEDVSGVVELGLFTPRTNSFLILETLEAGMAAGQSGELTTLDRWGQFRTENILYARFVDKARGVDVTNLDYVDTDRRLVFPEAKLALSLDGDVLGVSSDRFARFVELSGSDGGDEFGFYFEDNYFDLLPGVVKKVRILGRHTGGVISAKAHYSPHTTEIIW